MPKEYILYHPKPVAYIGKGVNGNKKYREGDTISIIKAGMWRGRNAVGAGGVHLEGNLLEIDAVDANVMIDISALLEMVAEHDADLLFQVLQLK